MPQGLPMPQRTHRANEAKRVQKATEGEKGQLRHKGCERLAGRRGRQGIERAKCHETSCDENDEHGVETQGRKKRKGQKKGKKMAKEWQKNGKTKAKKG